MSAFNFFFFLWRQDRGEVLLAPLSALYPSLWILLLLEHKLT